MTDNDCIKLYSAKKRLLKIISYGGALVLFGAQIIWGQLRYQKFPLFVLDGVEPVTISLIVIAGLIGILVFIAFYWKCPKCQALFFFKVRGNRFTYTFDLKECPECHVLLK